MCWLQGKILLQNLDNNCTLFQFWSTKSVKVRPRPEHLSEVLLVRFPQKTRSGGAQLIDWRLETFQDHETKGEILISRLA